MKKTILSVAGTVAALASTFALIDYKHRQDPRNPSPKITTGLVFGVAAALAGNVLTALAEKPEKKDYALLTEAPDTADGDLMPLDNGEILMDEEF